MAIDLKQCLRAATHAAEHAGNIVWASRGALLTVRTKDGNPRDFVTDVDRRVEAEILRMLGMAFPDYAFFGEETHRAGARINPQVPTWLVDPIDGTTNFMRGIPYYATSIALWYQNEPLVGVVHEIPLKRTWAAHREGHAVCGKKLLAVSKVADLAQTIVFMDWPDGDADRAVVSETFSRLQGRTAGLRIMNSSTLSVCYVAAGIADAQFASGVHAWDIAAAALFMKMAGGKITDQHGNPWTLDSRVVLTSNSRIHDEVRGYVQEGTRTAERRTRSNA